jgi:heptosyltransferase-3
MHCAHMKNSDQTENPSASTAVAATPVAAKRSSSMDRFGRQLVANVFRRMFLRLSSNLCGPGKLPAEGIHRVLISRPNHRLGNTVLMSALISEVQTLYPGAEIDLVGSDATDTIYASLFGVYRVFALPRRIARHLWFTASLLREIRSCRYDLAIDACNGSQSGKILLSLANARFKVGFPEQGTELASAWQSVSWPEHLAHRAVFLLRKAYAGKTSQDYPPLHIALAPPELEQAQRMVARLCPDDGAAGDGPVLGVFANATGAKCYGEGWWDDFFDAFQERCPEVRIIELVAAHGRSNLGDRFTPFYTRNLRHLAAMVAVMDGFISADCGVMHLAAASGTPTLGLFSVTDPAKYAPYGGANKGLDTRNVAPADAARDAASWFASLPQQESGQHTSHDTSTRHDERLSSEPSVP